MSRIQLACTMIILSCLLFGCQQHREEAVKRTATAVDTAADTGTIKKLSDEYGAAVTAGDTDRFLDLFTDDAILMPPESQMIVGKERIRPWVRSVLEGIKNTGSEEVTTPSEIRISGDWGFDSGVTTFKSGGKPMEYTNKYIRIWQKPANGSWKLARVIWNANNVPPSPSEKAQ